jgi:hypothetical protein
MYVLDERVAHEAGLVVLVHHERRPQHLEEEDGHQLFRAGSRRVVVLL